MLAVKKSKRLFEIIPDRGLFRGQVVATAETVVLAKGDLTRCTLHSVWGLVPKLDISSDATLLRDLSLFGRTSHD